MDIVALKRPFFSIKNALITVQNGAKWCKKVGKFLANSWQIFKKLANSWQILGKFLAKK